MATTKEIKKPTTKAAAAKKPAAPRKKKAVAEESLVKELEEKTVLPEVSEEAPKQEAAATFAELNVKEGRYAYAVGRRKTSVANVRIFVGKGESQVNKKTFMTYFGTQGLIDEAMKPLQLTGISGVYVYVNVKGGGTHSQAQAIAHGIATAITKTTPEMRKVLKKNGSLTRDSRMKERKKPGLKRARKGSQWAKR
jgi:small subunit ribosomal protein S9